MDKLRFGTAGIPISTTGDTIQGIKDVKKLDLESMEIQFVRSIYLKKESTPEINKVAKENNIILACHAPYYINLNSFDKNKLAASINYIVNSAKIASLFGAYSVCFHAGYYQQQDPSKVYLKIRNEIKEIVSLVKEFDNNIWIRPEISGKLTQFGNLKELIQLSQDIEQVLPCIDYSHLYAKTLGKNNTYLEFKNILETLEKELGRISLDNTHIHVSGIEFGNKGERHHLTLNESKFNYKDLLKALKEFNTKGIVTSESTNIEKDAILMKKYYNKI